MDWKCVVLLLLLLVNLVSAAELRLDGELHYKSLEVTLQNNADYEVNLTLKAQLKQKTDGWVLLDTIDCGGNFSINALESKEVNCNYTTPQEFGEYKIYVRADIHNSTYTYKNFYFNIDKNGFKEPESNAPILLKIISAPEKVKTGEEFTITVNVTASKKILLEIYSYVHEGKTCYSFYGWKGNAETYEFKAGETKTLNLTDSVAHDATNGTYQLKVRARGDKDYDIVQPIEVEQMPIDLFKEIPEPHNTSDFPPEIFLLLLALIPLIFLIITKLL